MIIMFICTLLMVMVSVGIYCASNNNSEFFSAVLAILLLSILIMVPVCFIFGFKYFSADYKKDIINREYGTNYTQEEVFFASDVIDKIRELNRKRIEINGNLLKDDDK